MEYRIPKLHGEYRAYNTEIENHRARGTNSNTEVQRSRIQRYRLQFIQNTEIQRYRFAVNNHIAKGFSTHRETEIESQSNLQIYSTEQSSHRSEQPQIRAATEQSSHRSEQPQSRAATEQRSHRADTGKQL